MQWKVDPERKTTGNDELQIIHMVIALLAPGSSIHTVRWANAFVFRGHRVHLITQHAPSDDLVPSVSVHLLPHFSGAGYLLNGPRLKRILRTIRPDVVNAHYATGYGTLVRSCSEFPVVLNVWGSDVYDFPRKGPIHRWWLCGNLRRADVLVSTSEAMADHTLTLCPELTRATVVPFGVDTELFKPVFRDPHAVAPLVVGTVKTLAPKYGIDTLLHAFALLPLLPAHGMELHVVGSGPQEPELRALARSLGITDRVRFIPRVPHDRVPGVLAGFDVYVALSRMDSESFGVAVIEASACGIPVVVSDVGGLPEVVKNGITGFVVPRQEASAAAEKIEQLLRSPELRERMGKAGVDLVKSQYEWNACVDRMLHALQQGDGTAH